MSIKYTKRKGKFGKFIGKEGNSKKREFWISKD